MIAVEVGPFESIEDVLLDADGNPMGHGRPVGLHLGTIVKARRAARGGKGAPPGWQEGAAMYFGFLWEWAIELAFKAIGLLRPNTVKQLRLVWDRIHMTLDGVCFEEETYLEEYKATWRSMRKIDCEQPLEQCLEENFPEFLDQIRGYLYALGKTVEQEVTVCRLFIFFIMGDYRGTGPRVRVFDLRFEQEELERYWKYEVLPTAQDMLADMEANAGENSSHS